MKKFLKITGWLLLIAFIGLQFFRPAKNVQAEKGATHISNKFSIPAEVNTIMAKACYDCHSNNSNYPWYFNIQPVGMWMDGHIKNGKSHLNFSEYTDKRLRYQYHKMEEVIEQVKDNHMPLSSYTWTHKDARLTDSEKNLLIDWAGSVMDTMKAWYPMDSLIRKRP